MEKVKTLHWVQGNTLALAIPLQSETMTPQGKVTEDYFPQEGDSVVVNLKGNYKSVSYDAEVSGNIVTIRDNGTLPAGVYAVEIVIVKENGSRLRSMLCNQVEIHRCNDGVLDEWNDFVVPDSQTLDAAMFYFAKGDKGDPGTYIPESIIFEEDGIYQIKDNEIYPVSHPDLSTQPSILPQRFGNLPIREVLIANGRENEIPIGATVLEAFSFNDHQCVSAFLEKDFERRVWSITNDKGVVPEFTLVRYVGEDNGGYYYNPYRGHGGGGGGGQDEEHLLCTLTLLDDSVVEVRASGSTLTHMMISEKTAYTKGNIKSAVVLNYVVELGGGVFADCTNLHSVVIPDSVTTINGSAFSNCKALTSISIPNSVTFIGNSAFSGCTILSSITLSNSLHLIGNFTFYNCMALTSISIPNITVIGNSAFSNCISLTSITIPDGVSSIGTSAFGNCRSLTFIHIPNSVTYINNGAFQGCKALTSITIPESVISIGGYVFRDCRGLTSINIPNSVTIIGQSVFRDCSGLTSITIGNSVTLIGSYAFYGCTALTSITLHNSLTEIGSSAFSNCSELTTIRCEAIIAPSIAYATFNSVRANGTLEVPQGSTGYEAWMTQLTPQGWTKVES